MTHNIMCPPQAFRSTLNTHRRGMREDQPHHLSVLEGTLYYVVDEGLIEQALRTGWVPYRGAADGSLSLVNFSYSINTASPPSTNQVRFNAGHPYTSVNAVYFDNVSADGQDLHRIMMKTLPASTLYIQKKNDHTQYATFKVIGQPVDNGSWIKLTVSHLANGLAIGGGQLVLVQSIVGGQFGNVE